MLFSAIGTNLEALDVPDRTRLLPLLAMRVVVVIQSSHILLQDVLQPLQLFRCSPVSSLPRQLFLIAFWKLIVSAVFHFGVWADCWRSDAHAFRDTRVWVEFRVDRSKDVSREEVLVAAGVTVVFGVEGLGGTDPAWNGRN